jgi:hypothetical protein
MDMPKEIDELKNDLVWAKHYVNQYKKLFLNGQKRIDFLNETAPGFFRDIQRMYWNEMVISVARLMDPYEQGRQGKYKNLSLQILTKLAKENQWVFEPEITDLIDKARKISEPAIIQRMKRVAHRDLPTAMKRVTLDKVGINEIEEALSLAGKALNVVYWNLTDSSWSWDLIVGHDAGELIHYLKLAVIYKELNEKEKDWMKENELWRSSKYYDA